MPNGRVKFFDASKGFGFIDGDDGDRVYLNASLVPEGLELTRGTRVSYSVAEGRRGPQALSIEVLEQPARINTITRETRKPADEMAVIVEDLVKLLDAAGTRLKHGQYPQHSQQVAKMLRRVADDFDA